jgi:HEAT repeat protein
MKSGLEARTRIMTASHVSPVFAADFWKVLDNLSWATYDILMEEESLVAARECAIGMLAELGPVSDAIVPTIAGALRDGNPRLRIAAMRALGRLGSAAVAAIPALRLATHEPDPAIQEAAREALSQLGDVLDAG